MRSLMVRYKVKADRAAENESFIKKVFEELEHNKPAGLHYASFKLGDGQSFVHIASIATEDGSNPLTALESFKAFSAQIKDRCEEAPATVELSAVGLYRFFAP